MQQTTEFYFLYFRLVILTLLFCSSELQAQKCLILQNYNAAGNVVEENQLGIGGFNFVFTEKECCDLCFNHPDCNVYVQCLNEQGCPNEGVKNENILFGECALKYQQKVADDLGQPDFWFKGPQTLFSSGYIPGKQSVNYSSLNRTCTSENCTTDYCGELGQVCCVNNEEDNSTKNLYCTDNSTFCISLDGTQERSECQRILQNCGEVGQKCCNYAFTETITISNLDNLPLPCIAEDAFCDTSLQEQAEMALMPTKTDGGFGNRGVCTLNDKKCGRLGSSCCISDAFRGKRPREYCQDGLFCGFDNAQRICKLF